MGFEKGKPRLPNAGRKKGTPNKNNKEALLDICTRFNFNPFEALIQLAQSTEEDAIRLGALKEIASYVYPKLKSIEVIQTNEYTEKTVEELESIVVDKLKPKFLKLTGTDDGSST